MTAPTINSCATFKDKGSCEYERVHGPGGDPPDFNANPPYSGFIIPDGAGTNPSICEYSNKCQVELSKWNDNLTNKDSSSEELLDESENLKNAESNAADAASEADAAKDFLTQNPGDSDAIDASEKATKKAIEAQSQVSKLKENLRDNENENENDNDNDIIGKGENIKKSTLELNLGDDVINQIGGDLGKALGESDNKRALMEARNLVNRLEYFIDAGDEGAEDIMNKRNRIKDLLSQINSLNEQLQSEGASFNSLNANGAVILSGIDGGQVDGFSNFVNGTDEKIVTYTKYALLE